MLLIFAVEIYLNLVIVHINSDYRSNYQSEYLYKFDGRDIYAKIKIYKYVNIYIYDAGL
jgi:hypothetical protein